MRRLFDVTCAAAGLVLLSPLLALIALAVKLNGKKGSILYLQPRVGKEGREFDLMKFRSMVSGADHHGLLTASGDVRVTPLGRFLRKYKLDELPQLVNVLKCDMRLVGPRPEMKRYVDMFPGEYQTLLKDLPGITDPASLAYRYEETMLKTECPEEYYVSHILPHKLRLSLEYAQSRTFFSDLKIIFQTLGAARTGEQRGPSPRGASQQPSNPISSKK